MILREKIRYALLLMLMAPTPLVAKTLPFESVVVTNGLSYSRTRDLRHHESDYPNSRLGMNKFSERAVSHEEIVEATYGALRFLKYTYSKFVATETSDEKEVSTLYGRWILKDEDQFPTHLDNDIKFKGKSLKDLRIVVFPFKVENKISDDALEMILVKIYFKGAFQGACYYSNNTSDVSLSFIEASGNEHLVGHESKFPYLTADEQIVQERLCHELQERISRPRQRVFPSMHMRSVETSDIQCRGK